MQVEDHTEARQYMEARQHAHVHNRRQYEEMYQKRCGLCVRWSGSPAAQPTRRQSSLDPGPDTS